MSKLESVGRQTVGERPGGLYRREEHDACGVGFVADLNAPASYRVVTQALECLGCLTHRGGVDADGASITAQVPVEFFAREARRLNSWFQPHWRIAVGVFFFPSDGVICAGAMFAAEEAVRNRGLYVAGWRRYPHGSAGQSSGAFLTEGLRLMLDGEANDCVGKGLGGGELIFRRKSRFSNPPKTSSWATPSTTAPRLENCLPPAASNSATIPNWSRSSA